MYSKDTLLDAISAVSFIMSIANYSENMSQSETQEMINKVVKDIHGHLEKQDKKIDKIMDILQGGGKG